MKYLLSLLLVTFTWLAASLPARADSPAGQWRTYPTGDLVTALAAHGDTLWVGTSNGAIRFNRLDGNSTRYTTADGLVAPAISSIAVDRNGVVLFGAWGGNASKFDGQSWTPFYFVEGGQDNVNVSGIAIDSLGRYWFGLYGYGVYGLGEHYTTADGLAEDYVLSLAASGTEIWIGTRLGLSWFNGHTWLTYTAKDGLTSPTVTALAVDNLGNLWAGTYNGGVNRLDGQGWRGFTTADGLPDDQINDIVIDAAGQPWIATAKGAAFFDGQNWTTITSANGLLADHVTALAVDDDGHIWFGSPEGLTEYIPPAPASQLWLGTSNGVTMFDGETWQSYTSADGLVNDEVRAIAIDWLGRKWFGTAAGASLFDGQSWQTFTPLTSSLVSNYVHAIAVDARDRKWFGYGPRGQGVTMFDGETWQTFTRADGLIDDQVYAIAFDSAGQTWLGTAAGVSAFDGQSWRTFTADDGLPPNPVRALAVGPDDRVWLGSEAGVSVYNGQNWTTYTAADGLAGDSVLAIAVQTTPAVPLANPDTASFSGEWQSIDRTFPFGLTLQQQGTALAGWHCGALPDASRTDCQPKDSPDYSVVGTVDGAMARVQITSSYGGGTGQAIITATESGLLWCLLERPAGEFYFPEQAELQELLR